jgi:predicted MFS family arabinose efflux permease
MAALLTQSQPRRYYAHYIVGLLLITYIFNQLDRSVFSILMEPIRRSFSLTDTQLGFVSGPALALLYACLGVPVARWADRSRRVTIMAAATALWSAVAMLTAAVGSFWQLALVRAGVGVGEAGFSAVAVSVIGDYKSDEDRARAISNFMLAIPMANVVSNLMGGWVNQLYGWRAVFVVAGLPGLLLALLMWATVREPPRRRNAGAGLHQPSLRIVLMTLWQRRSLRHLAIAQGLANIVINAMSWVSVFFIRRHHMSTGELGSWFVFTDGVGGFVGIWLSGLMVAYFGAKDPRMRTRLMAYASGCVAPLALFVLWCPVKPVALLGCFLLNIPMLFYLGPTAALVQDLVGANMRATMASVFFLIQLLAGGVIGTQLVGILSDDLKPFATDSTAALRWSMTLVSMVTLWAAFHFWRAARSLKQDLADTASGETPLSVNRVEAPS